MMPSKKLYKISEIMKQSGLSRQTVHNYTMLGLITEEERTPEGHRLYPESTAERLRKIRLLSRHRTLREVGEILKKESGETSTKD
jgi:DNA-binding transcriptional MerR regulator